METNDEFSELRGKNSEWAKGQKKLCGGSHTRTGPACTLRHQSGLILAILRRHEGVTDPDIASGVERSIPFRLYLGKIDEVRDKAGGTIFGM